MLSPVSSFSPTAAAAAAAALALLPVAAGSQQQQQQQPVPWRASEEGMGALGLPAPAEPPAAAHGLPDENAEPGQATSAKGGT
jgi:alkylation response protein AidB-like acyl-CoA dehydrogenase